MVMCKQVCKYFLDAVEKKQYGWFWVCPNGGKDCHYRHALPPGYVLKSQMKALIEEEADKTPIEDEIEDQVISIDNIFCDNNVFFFRFVFKGSQKFSFPDKYLLNMYHHYPSRFIGTYILITSAIEIDCFNSNDSRLVHAMEEEKDGRKGSRFGCSASRKGQD